MGCRRLVSLVAAVVNPDVSGDAETPTTNNPLPTTLLNPAAPDTLLGMTRREVLFASLASRPLLADNHIGRSRISAITDEIGKTPAEAIAFARQYGLQWVELRGVPGGRQDYHHMPEAELRAFAKELGDNGLKVSFLNTAMLKFGLPGTEPVRRRQESAEARARSPSRRDSAVTRACRARRNPGISRFTAWSPNPTMPKRTMRLISSHLVARRCLARVWRDRCGHHCHT